MRIAEALIDEIVAASGIPSASRRREVVRELRCHVEDFVLNARSAGHADAEIEKMVRANFGDPLQVGHNFAWVYRKERAILRLTVFGLVTLVVASLSAAGTIMLQAGVSAGFGVPIMRTLGSRHTIIEALDILATVAFYAGIISLERIFAKYRFPKAIMVQALVLTALSGCSAVAGFRAPYLLIGFVNAIFLRTVRAIPISEAARFGTALASFGLFGFLSWARFPGTPYGIEVVLASWLTMGLGYQVMTILALRADRELFNRLQQLH